MEARTGHYEYLDGIRGILAAIVVLSHIYLTVGSMGNGLIGYGADLFFKIFAGHYAVDYFIVLSGFCLTLPFARSPIVISMKWCFRFICKRFVRIVLPYWVAIAFSLLCIALLIGKKTGTHWDVTLPVTPKDVIAHIVLLQDFLNAVPKINHVFWSISVEWHIYFFFPFIMVLFQKHPSDRARICLTGAALVASFMIFKALVPYFDTYQAMNYLGLFVMGIFGCYIASGRSLKKVEAYLWGGGFSACACVGIIIRSTRLQMHVAGHNFDYLVGLSAMCALIYLAKSSDSMLRKLLSTRAISGVGIFAFSTYLIHAPLIQIAWQYLFAPFRSQPLMMFGLLSTFGMILVYISSYIFFCIIEKPCHLLIKYI